MHNTANLNIYIENLSNIYNAICTHFIQRFQ